jgi:CheY-like chemotaxis protein
MTNLRQILLAEDNSKDAELTLMALKEGRLANDVAVVRDGEEALDYIFHRAAFRDRPGGDPGVVLLDLKMPKIDGLEVLRQMKASERTRRIPVVILTSSRQEIDLVKSYDLGANAFVVKPVEFNKFVEAVKQTSVFWAIVNEPPPTDAPNDRLH